MTKKAGRKKRLLFQSDFVLMKTGFGRNARTLLSYLHKTGKYEILHYCCGIQHKHAQLSKTPWKSVGALPDDEKERKEEKKKEENKRTWHKNGLSNLEGSYEIVSEDLYKGFKNVKNVCVKLAVMPEDKMVYKQEQKQKHLLNVFWKTENVSGKGSIKSEHMSMICEFPWNFHKVS